MNTNPPISLEQALKEVFGDTVEMVFEPGQDKFGIRIGQLQVDVPGLAAAVFHDANTFVDLLTYYITSEIEQGLKEAFRRTEYTTNTEPTMEAENDFAKTGDKIWFMQSPSILPNSPKTLRPGTTFKVINADYQWNTVQAVITEG